MRFQRVHIPVLGSDHPDGPATLYGVVELRPDGTPAKTCCASSQPSAYVDPIGWLEDDDGCYLDPGYWNWYQVRKHLVGDPFEAESMDEAREEAQGNW